MVATDIVELGEGCQVLGEKSTAPQGDRRDGQRVTREILNRQRLSVTLDVMCHV